MRQRGYWLSEDSRALARLHHQTLLRSNMFGSSYGDSLEYRLSWSREGGDHMGVSLYGAHGVGGTVYTMCLGYRLHKEMCATSAARSLLKVHRDQRITKERQRRLRERKRPILQVPKSTSSRPY
jgi:hypothetical protein